MSQTMSSFRNPPEQLDFPGSTLYRRSVRPKLTPSAIYLLACSCSAAPPRQLEDQQSSPTPVTAPMTATATSSGPWADCYSTFTPTGNPKLDLQRITRACGTTGGMRAVTPVAFGEQRAEDPVDRYTFYVPKAGACYRVYAVGDRSVEDLDVLLRGPDGTDVIADLTHDNWPVVPPNGPVCFPSSGLYLLEVSVFRGAGRYAIQVWGK